MKSGTALVDAITATDRHRKDLGDLGPLVESIKTLGLLHPIVVTSDLQVIAGQRRLESVRRLGWREVDVRIADDLDAAASLLSAERDENTCRKDMTASELYALGAALTELERPEAAERIAANLPTSPKRAGARSGEGPVSEVVAPAVGMSDASWRRLKVIGDSASEGDEAAAEILTSIDEGKESIYGGYQQYRKSRTDEGSGVSVKTKTHKGRAAADGGRRVLNTLVGMAPIFDDLDPDELALDADEVTRWERDLKVAVSAINRFRKRLREEA